MKRLNSAHPWSTMTKRYIMNRNVSFTLLRLSHLQTLPLKNFLIKLSCHLHLSIDSSRHYILQDNIIKKKFGQKKTFPIGKLKRCPGGTHATISKTANLIAKNGF